MLLDAQVQEPEVPPYMDKLELQYTALCHPGELDLLNNVMA